MISIAIFAISTLFTNHLKLLLPIATILLLNPKIYK